MHQIQIAQPMLGDAEKQSVMEVLDSGQLVQGQKVAEFEAGFAAYCQTKHGVATTNGTTALTVALMAYDIGRDDEVIIPSFTFIATATSVLSAGAKPVFVDIEDQTFCIDPHLIEAAITKRTKAIMPVHLYGQPACMQVIAAIAEKHGLAIIEDAAQAHGAAINGEPVGGWGMAAFSFYPSKNMTTGEGGMVTTASDALAEKARMIRNHGMSQQYFHEVVGFNFRMTNIMAAIGVVQLQKLESWNEKRIANAAYLTENLKTVRPPVIADGCRHVFHQYTVLAPEGTNRDAMVKRLNERGIGVRVYYPLPVHEQPVFKTMGYSPQLPVTENLTARVFSLPVHPGLSQDDLERIVHEVNSL
ncbi:MAG TPA: DegT/DnrJ/EryC1/StrS family aminotransferase [Aggregatilineales bacterium]|nr:DegT/DnrJ/EryC1/StrS family aminotransferase [Aggregatilineales bacterium]